MYRQFTSKFLWLKKSGGWGRRTCCGRITIKPIHKWNKEIVFGSIWSKKKKKHRYLYLWYTGWMLSSDGEFNWGLSPFSRSAQSSTSVNPNTSSMPEGSYGESLVQVSLPRTLLAIGHVASSCWDHPGLWAAVDKKKYWCLKQLLKKSNKLSVRSQVKKKLFETDEFSIYASFRQLQI